jgi:hypothetical protein
MFEIAAVKGCQTAAGEQKMLGVAEKKVNARKRKLASAMQEKCAP